MALQKEIWIADIEKQLFASNQFMNVVGKDHSAYIENITVHVPQAGARPGVAKDRTSLPASINQRTDVDLTYNLSQYSSDPTLITDLDELQINYSKRQDVLESHIKTLSDAISNQTLYAWAASGASRIVRTTGTASSTALAPSATSTRLAITLADLRAAAAKLDKDNIIDEERYCILPSDMYWQLIGDSEVRKALEFGRPTQIMGELPMVAGIYLIKRSSVVVYDNTGTPVIKAVGSDGVPTSPATSDNLGALVVSKSYVCKAKGTTKVYADEDKPEYYGSIFSAQVQHGAAKLRTNQEGIVSIVQAA